MKFKYHYQEQKLWRIEEDYSYQISEANRLVEFLGLKISFNLGLPHWLSISFDGVPTTKMNISYFKGLKNGETIHYEKQIKTDFWKNPMVVFEFTAADQKSPTKN